MDEDEVAELTASARRALIRAANRESWSATDVSNLLAFFERTYDLNVTVHPSFPLGVLVAYRAAQE